MNIFKEKFDIDVSIKNRFNSHFARNLTMCILSWLKNIEFYGNKYIYSRVICTKNIFNR
jgi:hypothetical protein